MASVNRVIVLGNLGRDPEIRYTSDERAIANLSLATSSRYKDKSSGELKEQTEWHKICLLYTSPSPRDVEESRMPSSA